MGALLCPDAGCLLRKTTESSYALEGPSPLHLLAVALGRRNPANRRALLWQSISAAS